MLTRLAHAADIRVSPLPGASSVIAALSASGLPADRFTFAGFIPAKAASGSVFLTTTALLPIPPSSLKRRTVSAIPSPRWLKPSTVCARSPSPAN
ncbi:hypothetical protein [Cardiobacterium hominis]|uniref:hypothetical protein n=1 Tax=Cardiobacterium hominis TaxID=2718 RepID=UPI0028898C21|nr:hypothetical protein [Cardiobacterium hominis]